jgi:hypothetical protein
MASPQSSTAARWQAWHRLYPAYCSLAREFVLETPPCDDLAAVIETPSAENVAEAQKWFAAMDSRIHIHHLRHFAQTSPVMTEQAVSDFLFLTLAKEQKDAADHDKADFLVVQLLAMRLPLKATASDLDIESVIKLLEPSVGSPSGDLPTFTKDIEGLITEANAASNLNALFTSRIIERCREIKQSCGDGFFQPAALAAFARFGYMIRHRFFQLMQQDLNAILDGLRELETRGVSSIDCRKAQFSGEEPLTRIRMICQSWRVMFQAEYSSGQPLCLLVDLKTAVEQAMGQNKDAQPATKHAAAAGGTETITSIHR